MALFGERGQASSGAAFGKALFGEKMALFGEKMAFPVKKMALFGEKMAFSVKK